MNTASSETISSGHHLCHFVLPTLVIASAFRALFESNGIVNSGMMDHYHLDLPSIQLDQTMLLCRSAARPGSAPDRRHHPDRA
ncbi:hypothetical protein JWG42_04790 [Desulfoprunum benzoelyticum]|uniref:Uncharacterized protein n=1 Tax=Desulfoprunum benzoelyticum TaxID=1506996 RepID=A0A840UZI7_9BACT|nr:hypothetical protein [Desulfoprunum benzoelyticum]MBB5346869.1 hypothetical protein [Desulfoprunum benzoelyticum]MBM9529469.1 hypothetical protein [Desulfoprunum benzoelyticum]